MGFDAVPEPLKKSSSVLRDPLTGVRIISGHNNNVYREEWRRGANHGGVCICKRCTCDKQKAIRCPCRCHEQVKYVSRRRLAYADRDGVEFWPAHKAIERDEPVVILQRTFLD